MSGLDILKMIRERQKAKTTSTNKKLKDFLKGLDENGEHTPVFQGRGPSTIEWRSFKKNFVTNVQGETVKKDTAKTNNELLQYIKDNTEDPDRMTERDQQDEDQLKSKILRKVLD